MARNEAIKPEPMGFFVHRFWFYTVAAGILTAASGDAGTSCAYIRKPRASGPAEAPACRGMCASPCAPPGYIPFFSPKNEIRLIHRQVF